MAGIVEAAMDAIITVDEMQRVVQFNAAAEAMFGCPREEALGSPLALFIPGRFHASHEEHVRAFGKTAVASRRMGVQRIILGLRRNGSEFPLDASISQSIEHGARYYTAILRDVTERVRVEAELRDSKADLKAFASAAHTVREQEKSRIARELHDELGQALTALKMDVAWLRARLGEVPEAVGEKLGRMEQLLNNTVMATRRISSELRPLILDDLGVLAATESLVEGFRERAGIPCELILSDPDLNWTDPLATAIFRIVQESLTNIARHAQASHARVEIRQTVDAVILVIQDDGVGFPVQGQRNPKSFGLMGLRERTYLLGGEAQIESSPGGGTRIEVRLPLHPEGSAA